MTEPAKADNAEFARRVSVSLLWVAVGTIVSKLVRVAALFVVLGFITDAELGVAQLALTVFVIVRSVTELGLGAALVRTKDASDEDIAALFWVSVAMSLTFYAVVFVLSFFIASWYERPILAPLLQVQSLGIVFFALFVVPKSLLTRDLRMGRVTFAENFAGALSAIVMIVSAVLGLGVWSIILGEVSSRLIEMIIYQVTRPYFPRFVWAPGRIRSMISFGLYNTGSRFLGRFYTEADYLVIGRMFSDAAIGLYAFAFRTVDDIVKALAYMITQVAYPTFAKLQYERVELRGFVFGIARGSSLLIGIVLAFIFVFMEPLLASLGYERWIPAVHFVQLFCAIGILRSIIPILSALINALGEARYMFIYASILSLVLPIAFIIGAQFSVEAVAWAWLIAYPPVTFMLMLRASRLLEVPLSTLFRGIFAGLAFPILLTGGLWFARLGLEQAGLGPGLVTTLGLMATLGAGAAFTWRFERPFVQRLIAKKPSKKPAT